MSDLLASAFIKHCARSLGFAACGIAPAERVSAGREKEVRTWLKESCNGDMHYLSAQLEKRLDPRLLVEGARSVVSVALNYFPARTLSADGYQLARYALGKDYHDVVREKLRRFIGKIGLQEWTDGRAFCDTAPIDEHYWAWRCGIGWRGRNSQIILPHGGSYFFLGELVLTHEVDSYDTPLENRCGQCCKCIEACPTGALDDGRLDARRCLSYLTIEKRGELPDTAKAGLGRCIYGCDRCAEACPWNHFARPTNEEAFRPSDALCRMTAADWQQLTVEQYQKLFKGSAVKRAKYEGLLRNIQAVSAAEQQEKEGGSGTKISHPEPSSGT